MEEKLLFKKWKLADNATLPLNSQYEIYRSLKDKIHHTQKRTSTLTNILYYVAALVAGIIITSVAYNYLYQAKEPQKEYVVYAEKGQRANIILPDGTNVSLNSDTEIHYFSDYGDQERRIHLNGEAYFDVAKDSLHRFIISTNKMEIEALGTKFNVKSYEEEDLIIATLLEGRIKATVGEKSLELNPNESIVYNRRKNTLIKRYDNQPDHELTWMKNELTFKAERLGDIAILLNRMYNTTIIFESEKIKDYRFDGVIKNKSLENILELIGLTSPITHESKGDTIILKEKANTNKY